MPGPAEELLRRGDDLFANRRYAEALAALDQAIALAPDLAEAQVVRGRTLQVLGRDEDALAAFDRAFALDPDFDYLAGARWHLKMELCAWDGFAADRADLLRRIEAGKKASAPFMLLMTDRADLARKAAETWSELFARAPAAAPPPPARDSRIRVGYFSGDFRNHALTHLMTGMFERHDRAVFHTTAFSFGPDDRSDARRRVEAAFDAFIDVRGKTDADIAAIARSRQIDIAVDLAGFTQHGRIGIFSRRAAPVQVSYMGSPGTMGADFYDYVIADAVVIPDADRRWFTEKVAALPDSYYANDDQRVIADRVFTRSECGLPERGFVFCCFNAVYKITPEVFDVWARILKRVPGSVLWLLSSPATAETSLRKEAARRGLDPQRLIFAGRMPVADHLARHRQADLFLDTLPYNAHTTAVDALWAGLPVLTCLGQTFAGRVAASLLRAVGLPELVTTSPRDYEELAVRLALDPVALAALKAKLALNRTRAPLFDTTRFTRHFEAALKAMHQRRMAGLPPDHMHIGAM